MRCQRLAAAVLAAAAVAHTAVLARNPLAKDFQPLAGDHAAACKHADCGEHLIVTGLLEQGRLQEARDASRVTGIGNETSFAGFVTVNKSTNGNLFWWYFPHPSPEAPTLVWLQGGPGGPSTFAVFNEFGPYRLQPAAGGNFTVHGNPYTITQKYSVIFLDNPVGTGFSYVNPGGLCTDKTCYGDGIYEATAQLAGIFPAIARNRLYVTGESYAGKYVPMGAYTIHEANVALAEGGAAAAALKQRLPHALQLNLAGVAIGDGWVDPPTMVTAYPAINAAFGLASPAQVARTEQYVSNMTAAIKVGQYEKAYAAWDEYMNGDLLPSGKSFWMNTTGVTDYFNILRDASPAAFNYFSQYLVQPAQRAALHIGDATMHPGSAVEKALVPDVMQSVKPELAVLAAHYDVLVYSGQLDVIIGALLTDAFLPTMQWPGSQSFAATERVVWHLDGSVAGYARTGSCPRPSGGTAHFSRVIIRGAGHIAPWDQPARVLDMMTRFVDGVFWSG